MATPRFVHVGPGRYRDTQTGKVINSVMDPNKRMAQQQQQQNPKGGNAGATPTQNQNQIMTSEIDKLINDSLANLDPNFNPQSGIKEAVYTDPLGYDKGTYDSQYGLLTQNVQKNYDREYLAKSEELSQRGIPIGSDLYNKQMAELGARYDDIRNTASMQATSSAKEAYLKGAELEQNIINNQYNRNLTTQQQQNEIRNQLIAAKEAILSGKLNAREVKAKEEEIRILAQRANAARGGGGQDNSPIINAGTNAP